MSPSLEVLFDNAADAIIIAERTSGIILNANKAASRLLHLPHEKIVGMHQCKLHPKNDTSSFNNHVKDLDELGATVPMTKRLFVKTAQKSLLKYCLPKSFMMENSVSWELSVI